MLSMFIYMLGCDWTVVFATDRQSHNVSDLFLQAGICPVLVCYIRKLTQESLSALVSSEVKMIPNGSHFAVAKLSHNIFAES